MNQEHPYGTFLVAFVDVLDQRAKVRNMLTPESDDDREAILAQLKQTAGVVLNVRQRFLDIFQSLSAPTSMFDSLPPAERNEANKLTRSEIHTHWISDSVVISVQLTDAFDHAASAIAIRNCLFALSTMMLYTLAGGHPIRGGVDIGPCLSVSDTEVYGAGLERAYYLESQVAEYPRIVIGNHIFDYLNALKAPDESASKHRLHAGKEASRALGMMAIDLDGRLFLDFLGDEISNVVAMQPQIPAAEMIARLNTFINRSLYSFYCTDEKLYARYLKLSRYVETKRKSFLARTSGADPT